MISAWNTFVCWRPCPGTPFLPSTIRFECIDDKEIQELILRNKDNIKHHQEEGENIRRDVINFSNEERKSIREIYDVAYTVRIDGIILFSFRLREEKNSEKSYPYRVMNTARALASSIKNSLHHTHDFNNPEDAEVAFLDPDPVRVARNKGECPCDIVPINNNENDAVASPNSVLPSDLAITENLVEFPDLVRADLNISLVHDAKEELTVLRRISHDDDRLAFLVSHQSGQDGYGRRRPCQYACLRYREIMLRAREKCSTIEKGVKDEFYSGVKGYHALSWIFYIGVIIFSGDILYHALDLNFVLYPPSVVVFFSIIVIAILHTKISGLISAREDAKRGDGNGKYNKLFNRQVAAWLSIGFIFFLCIMAILFVDKEELADHWESIGMFLAPVVGAYFSMAGSWVSEARFFLIVNGMFIIYIWSVRNAYEFRPIMRVLRFTMGFLEFTSIYSKILENIYTRAFKSKELSCPFLEDVGDINATIKTLNVKYLGYVNDEAFQRNRYAIWLTGIASIGVLVELFFGVGSI